MIHTTSPPPSCAVYVWLAPANPPNATGAGSAPSRSGCLLDSGTHEYVVSQSGDTGQTNVASPEPPAHLSSASLARNQNVTLASVHKPGAGICHGRWHTAPEPIGPVRLPFFCVDLLHDLALKDSINQQLTQPYVFGFQRLQALEPRRAVLLVPDVDRRFAYCVTSGNLGYRFLVRLPQETDNLFITILGLLHTPLSSRGHCLKLPWIEKVHSGQWGLCS